MSIVGHIAIAVILLVCAGLSYFINIFLAAATEGQPDSDRWFALGIIMAIIFIILAIWSWWW